MSNYSRRDWWLVSLGVNAMGAFVGAMFHSPFLLIWNMVWVGAAIYMVDKLGEK